MNKENEHVLMFTAADCNDENWDVIIDTLRKALPDFGVFFADGDNMIFSWTDK